MRPKCAKTGVCLDNFSSPRNNSIFQLTVAAAACGLDDYILAAPWLYSVFELIQFELISSGSM